MIKHRIEIRDDEMLSETDAFIKIRRTLWDMGYTNPLTGKFQSFMEWASLRIIYIYTPSRRDILFKKFDMQWPGRKEIINRKFEI